MMKKVQFTSRYSQYFFLAPQLLILLIFLYWPIIQTFKDAFTMQDAFGFGSQFAGFDNFLFIVALNKEEPIKPHPIIKSLSNIFKYF